MLAYLVEFLATFIFIAVILTSNKAGAMQPLVIGLTLSALIWFSANISGGHLNPAVNLAMLLNKKMDMTQFIGQSTAQFFGAVVAFYFSKNIK